MPAVVVLSFIPDVLLGVTKFHAEHHLGRSRRLQSYLEV